MILSTSSFSFSHVINNHGSFSNLKIGTERGYQIEGSALGQIAHNDTIISVDLRGLWPNSNYISHLHLLPCEKEGGGHYKIDPTVKEAIEENEFWVRIKSDERGYARAVLKKADVANELPSIVIHDLDSKKIACMDFKPVNSEYLFAKVSPTPFGHKKGSKVEGKFGMNRTDDLDTVFKAELKGLEAKAQNYVLSVHELPCKLGGGKLYEYEEDSSVKEKGKPLSFKATSKEDGTLTFESTISDHITEPRANSVLLYSENDLKNPIGCGSFWN